MRDRPEQVSGFKLDRHLSTSSASIPNHVESGESLKIDESGLDECDEILEGVYDLFYEALAAKFVDDEDIQTILQEALKDKIQDGIKVEEKQKEAGGGLWEKMKLVEQDVDESVGFSFGFFGVEVEDEEILE